jgi:hypothetical protein
LRAQSAHKISSLSPFFEWRGLTPTPLEKWDTPPKQEILGLLIGGMNFCVAAEPPRKNSYLDQAMPKFLRGTKTLRYSCSDQFLIN